MHKNTKAHQHRKHIYDEISGGIEVKNASVC